LFHPTDAPITKIKTKKVKAQREKEIVLKCEVEAEPHPEFKWSHHHHVLKNVQSHGFSSNLTLLISEDDEFGKYICKAKNELGHVEVVFNVEEGVEEVTTLKPQKEPSTTTKASKPSIAIEITPFLFVTIIIPLLTSVILN
jgi:sorbitol-specific phosphotransferase system component IIA